MVTQYAALFNIECLHGYFAGKACPALAQAPTQECRKVLDDYRMLFRPTAGGGTVYCLRESTPDLLRLFDETAPLTFTLCNSDLVLNNYTDINLHEGGNPAESVYYFDNLANYQADAFGRRRQLLHPPSKAFAHSVLSVRRKMSSYALGPAFKGGDLKVIANLGEQVVWQVQVPANAGVVPLDLRLLPEGRYRLAVGGSMALEFYLSDQVAAQLWGVVAIYAGGRLQADLLPENCRALDNAGVASPRTFTIALDCRKTIWRYYIVDPTGKQDYGSYELSGVNKTMMQPDGSSSGEIRFVRRNETAPVNGHAAWVFESQSPLPLLQYPADELSFTLRPPGQGPRGGRAIKLPYAQPGSIVMTDGPEPRRTCSEIFVYV
jgi:hypothetical protein